MDDVRWQCHSGKGAVAMFFEVPYTECYSELQKTCFQGWHCTPSSIRANQCMQLFDKTEDFEWIDAMPVWKISIGNLSPSSRQFHDQLRHAQTWYTRFHTCKATIYPSSLPCSVPASCLKWARAYIDKKWRWCMAVLLRYWSKRSVKRINIFSDCPGPHYTRVDFISSVVHERVAARIDRSRYYFSQV